MQQNSEEMISLHIPEILRKAAVTFSSKSNSFNKNLNQLINLFNKTKATHVDFNAKFMDESHWAPSTKAPMSYVHIFSNNNISMGIFIIKPSMKLPLHNHPEMYGLLKVIAGTVKISSYSLNTEKTKIHIPEKKDSILRLVVERMDDIIANPESNCCVLEPNKGNIHEVQSVDGPAAFIDILSPPYDEDIPGVGERKCSYFRLEKELEPGIFEIREIRTPHWFWSDTVSYTGPTLSTSELSVEELVKEERSLKDDKMKV